MRLILKSGKMVAVLVAASVLAWFWIVVPFRQNQIVKVALRDLPEAAPAIRRDMDRAQKLLPWDPYLSGWGRLSEARMLRALGRVDDAVYKYQDALAHRLPHQHRIELGMYEWSVGRSEAARRDLSLAVRIHPHLLRQIEDREVRESVRAWLQADRYRRRQGNKDDDESGP